MNKKSVFGIILSLIFLVVFNTIFFVIGGTSHPASVWVSYGFIHFAYLMIILTPLLIRESSSSSVFGFSLYSISSVYFLIEFIVGLIFILVKNESYKFALIFQIIIAGIYIVLLFSNLIANEHTADNIVQHEEEVAYIKNAASRLKLLIGKAEDQKTNKELEKIYDLLHSSPSKSSIEVRSLESEIMDNIFKLENEVYSNNTDKVMTLIKTIESLVETRNRKVKLSN